MFDWFKRRRRRRLLKDPFPTDWRGLLSRRVRHYQQLPDSLVSRLEDCVTVMSHEREFEGCGGLTVNDDVRVTICGQASLLLLGVEGYYFDRIPTILVYPESYVRPSGVTDGQLIVDEDQEYAGEAWSGGPIVLSWRDVVSGGIHQADGNNVVLHEFAHHLDGLDGDMGGMPPLSSKQKMQRWQEVRDREYESLVHSAKSGRPTLIDDYGATNLAEFFAVSTECFFEQPREMARIHSEWYALLSDFYHVDPANWDWTW